MPAVNIRDLNNAKEDVDHIAEVATSSHPTATDRFGNTKKTVAGILSDAETTATTVLASLGYQPPIPYGSGIELTERTQTVEYEGQTYAPVVDDLPFTTSGTFETDKFRLIQGVSGADLGAPTGAAMVGFVGPSGKAHSLADLANPDMGALMVRGAVIYVDTVADLQALDTSELVDGQRATAPQGGYVWSAANQKWIPSGNGNSLGFRIDNAMWSWWAKPCLLRHVDAYRDATFIAFSESGGAVGVAEVDNVGRTIKTKIVSSAFAPDDHNTGAIVAGDGQLAAFFPGRRYTEGSSNNLWYSVSTDGSVDGLGDLQPLGVGGDYPNAYNVGDSILTLARNSQTGTQWRTRIGSWPIGTWSSARAFFASANYTWPYFATRRSRENVRKINLALGWHPNNEPHAHIYFGAIERAGTGDWEFSSSAGSANLSTGAGLPLTEADFELAYSAGGGEKTRLFDVSDDCFVFASYEGDGPAEYKYAKKSGGSWVVSTITQGGRPFYTEGSDYFGGVAIDDADPNIVYVSREDDRDWYIERYTSSDNGQTWELDSAIDQGVTPSGARSVLARPVATAISESSQTIGLQESGGAYFRGSYSERTFEEFSTSLVSMKGYEVTKPGFVEEEQGFCHASVGSRAGIARSAVLASRLSRSNGLDSAVISSNESESDATYGSIISSLSCEHGASASNQGFYRSIIASSFCSTAPGGASRSFIAGSTQSQITGSGNGRAVVASQGCEAGGSSDNIFIASSIDSEATSSRGSLIGSSSCLVSNAGATIIGGVGVASSANHTVLGGYGTGSPSTANRTWQFGSQSGNLQIAGALSEGVNFSDIAKMIQNGEGSEIEPGYLLTLIGEKVYKTREGERIDAIVAATPGIIQNDTPFTWQGRYLLDEWGRRQMQEAEWVVFDGYEGLVSDAPGDIPEDAVYSTVEVPIENPEYDPEQENVPRSERPDEWVLAGVHGIIRTRVDASVTQAAVDEAARNRDVLFVEAGEVPGIARLSGAETNVQVMAVEKEYDGDYGIARCLLR